MRKFRLQFIDRLNFIESFYSFVLRSYMLASQGLHVSPFSSVMYLVKINIPVP